MTERQIAESLRFLSALCPKPQLANESISRLLTEGSLDVGNIQIGTSCVSHYCPDGASIGGNASIHFSANRGYSLRIHHTWGTAPGFIRTHLMHTARKPGQPAIFAAQRAAQGAMLLENGDPHEWSGSDVWIPMPSGAANYGEHLSLGIGEPTLSLAPSSGGSAAIEWLFPNAGYVGTSQSFHASGREVCSHTLRTENLHLSIEREDSKPWVLIRAYAVDDEGGDLQHLQHTIQEALSIATFRRQIAIACYVQQEPRPQIKLQRPPIVTGAPWLDAPSPATTPMESNPGFWELFIAALDALRGQDHARRKDAESVARIVSSVSQAARAPRLVGASILCSAIEALCRFARQIETPESPHKAALLAHIKNWGGDAAARDAAANAVASALGRRPDYPKRQLKRLEAAGVVPTDSSRAWSELRNKLLHGAVFKSGLTSNDLLRLQLIIEAIHCLVLQHFHVEGMVRSHKRSVEGFETAYRFQPVQPADF